MSAAMRPFLLASLWIAIGLSVAGQAAIDGEGLLFTVLDNKPGSSRDDLRIVLDLKYVLEKIPSFQPASCSVVNRSSGEFLKALPGDYNSDGVADVVVLYFSSTPNVFDSFEIRSGQTRRELVSISAPTDSRFEINYLTSSVEWLKAREINWPDKIIESTLKFYPNPVQLAAGSPGQWKSEYSFFLNAAFLRARRTNNTTFLAYIRKWCDRFIDTHGNLNPVFYRVNDYDLENILPGRLFISLYQINNAAKYKNTATQLRDHLMYQPKAGDGSYWSKQLQPYQLHLKGIYDAEIFSAQYGAAFDQPQLIAEAINQIQLAESNNGDPETGLLFHAWDESGRAPWVDPDFGTSPEFWSQAIGWYAMALVDVLDYIPERHPQRKEMIRTFQKLAASVIKYQDKESGLWYQVMNKKHEPSNWLEPSASAMLAYALSKGHRVDLLHKTYYDAAEKTFRSLTEKYVYFDKDERIYFIGSTGSVVLDGKDAKADFNAYISTMRKTNDYAALGALLSAAMEFEIPE